MIGRENLGKGVRMELGKTLQNAIKTTLGEIIMEKNIKLLFAARCLVPILSVEVGW